MKMKTIIKLLFVFSLPFIFCRCADDGIHYELSLIHIFNYSFARNEIIYMDEVQKRYDYQMTTGRRKNQFFGLIFDGYYNSVSYTHLDVYKRQI